MKRNPTDRVRAPIAFPLMLLLASGAGCSFSYSSKSISDSISGSSESISDSSTSSSPADEHESKEPEALYREDVRNLTAAYVRQERHLGDVGDVATFQRRLGEVARQHGVSDWEASPATWAGVGEGLKVAAASPEQRDALESALAGDDAVKQRAIARGYDGRA